MSTTDRQRLEDALRAALEAQSLTERLLARALASERTARKEAEAARECVQEEALVNVTVSRIGAVLGMTLELDKLVQTLTDETTTLCHAQYGAYFSKVIDDGGESYRLDSLSGVPRAAFSRATTPSRMAVFAPTFGGAPSVRLDDVTHEFRYATHFGMPLGHPPIRSYLAISVMSRTGEVLGGLLFGHSKPFVFTGRDERLLVAVAAHAATAIQSALLREADRAGRACRCTS